MIFFCIPILYNPRNPTNDPSPGGAVAEGCLAEAKASGVQLGGGMYNAVLRAYLAETPEQPEEVKRLFGEMQELQVGIVIIHSRETYQPLS